GASWPARALLGSVMVLLGPPRTRRAPCAQAQADPLASTRQGSLSLPLVSTSASPAATHQRASRKSLFLAAGGRRGQKCRVQSQVLATRKPTEKSRSTGWEL